MLVKRLERDTEDVIVLEIDSLDVLDAELESLGNLLVLIVVEEV